MFHGGFVADLKRLLVNIRGARGARVDTEALRDEAVESAATDLGLLSVRPLQLVHDAALFKAFCAWCLEWRTSRRDPEAFLRGVVLGKTEGLSSAAQQHVNAIRAAIEAQASGDRGFLYPTLVLQYATRVQLFAERSGIIEVSPLGEGLLELDALAANFYLLAIERWSCQGTSDRVLVDFRRLLGDLPDEHQPPRNPIAGPILHRLQWQGLIQSDEIFDTWNTTAFGQHVLKFLESEAGEKLCLAVKERLEEVSRPQLSVALASEVESRFRLLNRLGAGAYGEVHRSRLGGSEEFVALKLARRGARGPEEWRTIRASFEKESAALLALNGRFTPKLTACNFSDDQLFIAMELVEGTTLKEFLEQHPELNLQQRVELGAKLAAGVADAERSQIYHRDLKLENIMIRANDHQPVVIDWGLAKIDLPSQETVDHRRLENERNRPPELFDDGAAPYGPEQQVWSLACVLWELLYGQHPFMDLDLGRTRTAIKTLDPKPAPDDKIEASPKVHAALLRALTKKPPSSRGAAGDLQRALSDS